MSAELTGDQPGAVGSAVRAAARFDRRLISIPGGLLAAIPVVVVLGGGIAGGKPVWGVTMGAGAMLVGIAWRTTGGRPPLAVMATDASMMALSTFVGCITGHIVWLHLIVLCAWSLMGGLLVSIGNRGGAVGTQAIIAFVVFGRFSEPAPAALGLATLVLAGGMAQVVFQTLVRWPRPLYFQRQATATAYRELARLARARAEETTLPAATALDAAADDLSSPAMLGDAAIMTLRSLVTEGYRMRVQLLSLLTLRRRQRDLRARSAGTATGPVSLDEVLLETGTALDLAARAIDGDDGVAPELERAAAAVSRAAEAAATAPPAGTPGRVTARHIAHRLAALAGQLRAISTLAPAAGQGGGLRSRRRYHRTDRPMERFRGYLDQLRANLSLHSPAGRHAVRLAVVVPLAELLARQLPVQHSYWVVVAAATVLRPEFGATFTRGTERVLGTCLGVALAGAIAVGLHPTGAETVILVGLLAWAGYAVFPASFAVGFAFITALVVFLLNAIAPDTMATASARLLDTLIGGAFGLAVYALWPTWSRGSAWQSLADLVAAERAYLGGVLQAIVDGRRPSDAEMTAQSRRARRTRTTAEATVARSLSEPATRRIDAEQSQAALGALRRLIQAAHLLRLDVQEERERQPVPALAPLRSGLDDDLAAVETALRARLAGDEPHPTPLPDLRTLHGELVRGAGDRPEALTLGEDLDEIVDAANGLSASLGLESVDADDDDDDDDDDAAQARGPRVRDASRRAVRALRRLGHRAPRHS